jgi:hypothetical protein
VIHSLKRGTKTTTQKSERTYLDRVDDESLARLLTASCCAQADAASTELLERGVLPLSIVHALESFYFLAESVVSARVAARKYGLQTSALLAIARVRSGTDPADWATDQGHPVFPGSSALHRLQAIEASFMEEAKHLATERSLSPAMQVANDPEAYLKKLHELGWTTDDLELLDLLSLADLFRPCDTR